MVEWWVEGFDICTCRGDVQCLTRRGNRLGSGMLCFLGMERRWVLEWRGLWYRLVSRRLCSLALEGCCAVGLDREREQMDEWDVVFSGYGGAMGCGGWQAYGSGCNFCACKDGVQWLARRWYTTKSMSLCYQSSQGWCAVVFGKVMMMQ